jgi:hypothetical protein
MSLAESKIKSQRSTWKRYKKLNSGHKHATFEFFKQNDYYDKLTDFEKIFAEMFWTRRFCNHSVKELSEDLGLNKTEVFILTSLLESQGATKPEKKFFKDTNIQKRTHKPLTKKGKKFMRAIVNKAWKGTPIAKSIDLGIVMVDGIPKLSETLSPCYKKKLGIFGAKNETKKVKDFIEEAKSKEIFEAAKVKEVLETSKRLSLRSNNKKYMLEKPAASSLLSFEKREEISREWLVWNPALFDSGAISAKNFVIPRLQTLAASHPARESAEYRRRGALIAEYASFKTCARRRLFEAFDFGKVYDEQMHIGIWRVLEKEPIKKIAKALKLMKKKLSKGKFRMKNFVGFFTHLMKSPDTMGFSAHKAQLYRDALDDKKTPGTDRLMAGQTSAEFVALAKEMEEKTGQKVDLKTLSWMMSKGDTQVWLKALQAVKFRGKLDAPRKATKTEDIFEKRMKTVTRKTEEAVRDASGVIQRDENGTILWRPVTKTEETGFYEDVLVGTREVPIEDHGKAPKEKVKSWVGLWVYAVKLGSVEKIDERFFQKKEKKMPRLPGSPPKEDFKYELVDDEPAFGEQKMPMLPPCGVLS